MILDSGQGSLIGPGSGRDFRQFSEISAILVTLNGSERFLGFEL